MGPCWDSWTTANFPEWCAAQGSPDDFPRRRGGGVGGGGSGGGSRGGNGNGSGNTGNKSNQQVIDESVDRAVNDLSKDDCAALFYTENPAGALREALKNNKIRAVPFGYDIKPEVGAQTNESLGVIYLASNRYFLTGRFNGGPVSQTTKDFSGLTQARVQETILIHEMLHLTGSVGADNNGQVIFPGNGVPVIGSGGVTSAVIQHCIK